MYRFFYVLSLEYKFRNYIFCFIWRISPLKCGFHGATRTICEGCECRKNGKVQQSYVMLQKIAKPSRGFGSVVNCSRASFFSSAGISTTTKNEISCERFPASRVVFYSWFVLKHVLKSFVICAGPTQDVRDVHKIFVNPQPDHDSLQNVSRKQRSSPDYFSTFLQTFCVRLETFSRTFGACLVANPHHVKWRLTYIKRMTGVSWLHLVSTQDNRAIYVRMSHGVHCSRNKRKNVPYVAKYPQEFRPWFLEHSRCSHLSRVFFVYVVWP